MTEPSPPAPRPRRTALIIAIASVLGGGAIIIATACGATPQRWEQILLAALLILWGAVINWLADSAYQSACRTAQWWEAMYRAELQVSQQRDRARWS
jgi:asparagine N-glycosylation enzyme membrane subunit Stt3